MTDIDSLAAALFGSKRAESQEVLTDATTRTYVGTALTDSKDGTVMVDLGGDVTLPDDVEGVSEHSAEGIEVSTGPGVRAGDEVVVTLVGGTPLKTPMVTGVAGEGDDQDARIATASAAAEEAWQWADEAHTAATDAQASASAAQESASSAASAASSAVSSAARAEQSAQQAIGDAARAESAAQQAVEDAADAAQAAGEAKTSAQQAVEEANEAHDAATAAQAEASRASQSATEAKGAATRANTAANDALAQVATVEDVIGVVDWVTEHGTYSLTTDTAIDPDKVYYTRTGSGTQADPYLYTAVPEPVAEDLGTYYELSVQEALSQYVASHLALTNAGLYVLKDASGYRLLLANDGMRVIDPAGHTVATYGESITFDSERPQRIGGTDSYIEWRDTNGDGVPDSLAIVADSIELGSGQSVSTGSGNVWANHTSATSASGISSWSDSFVTPTTAKPYVWMKSYSVIDGQRVYGNPACITGAKGADGTSVSVTSIEYATSTTESQPSSGWSTTAPSTVAEGSWLWTRVNYSDGSAAVSRAKQGKSGTSGSSSYTHIRYSAQADGTGFVSTPTASTVYVGIAVTSSSSAPTAKGSYTWSRYVGQQGPQGPQGKTGDTGVGVESYAQMWAKSTSKTTAPTSGWSESRPTSIGTNEYLWVRIDTTWTDGSTTQGTPVVDLNVTDLWHTSAALRVDVDSIDSDVDALKTTVSGHTTTIQQHTTSISQNSDAIALRATKTEVQQVRPAYASSSTAAGTAAKVATIDPAVTSYALYKGASVAVTFSTANTAATPTLNLNSTGAKQIRSYTGATLSEAEYKWAAGSTIDLVYDGTYWRMQDGGSVKRVTAAEASIRVNAENINLKVSKNDVINQINVSTEGAKIQASKVEIDGTAIFTAISSDVDDAITGKGYQTSSQVESAITSKGYQTSSQVNSAITSKGYATTTQAQGYATTAKSEAISAAASDATTKANAAETNAKAYTDSLEVGGRNLLPKTGSANGYYANTVPSGNHLTTVNDDGECYENSVTSTSAGIPMSSNVALVGLDSGSEYTLSMTVKSTVARKFGLQLRKINNGADGGDYAHSSDVSVAANTWTRLTYSFTGPSDASVYARLYVAAGTACTVRVRELQLERGNKATDWTPAPEDVASDIAAAQATANAAAPKANAVKRTQRIWYRTNASSAPATPGTASSNWVTKADDGNDAWTKMHIAISSTHKYIYTCEQYEMANGTVGYTSVLLDNTITVIDGGNIITGSVTANKLNAANINASKTLTVGAMTDAAASTILNSNVQIGGRNLLFQTSSFSGSGTSTSYFIEYTVNNGALKNSVALEAGVEYTFSADVTSSREPFQMTIGVGTGSYSRDISYGPGETLTSGRISITFKPTAAQLANGTIFAFRAPRYGTQGTSFTYTVARPKLEKGNKATDWSPAPEDQTEYADSIAYQTSKPNLSPYFSSLPYNSDNPYWNTFQTGSGYTFTDMGDGWMRVQVTNSGTSTIRRDFFPIKSPTVEPGKDYTFLVEFRNNASSGTASGTDCYLVQTSNYQFWGGGIKKNLEGKNSSSTTNLISDFVPGTSGVYTKRFVKTSEAVGSRNWTSGDEANVVGLAVFTCRCAPNTTIDYELRISLYEGEYTGPYKPYSGDQLYATNMELASTNESLEGAITDIGELSDQLVGTTTEQNKTITDIQTYLNSLRKDLDAEIQSRQQWLNFNSAEGLVIGAAGSTFKTVTTNTSQQFRSGGTVLAETSGTEFVAPVMRSDQLLIGNWMWTRRDNGNLSLKWIG